MGLRVIPVHSAANPRLRFIKRLANPSFRKNEGCTLVEGPRLVEEAIRSGVPFRQVVVTSSFLSSETGAFLMSALSVSDAREASSGSVEVIEVSEGLMRQVALTETPQGVLAVVDVVRPTPAQAFEALDGPAGLAVLCDGVADPGNMGTIVRSADAFGAEAVFYSDGSADPYNPKALRASMGSAFHLALASTGPLDAFVREVMARGYLIIFGDPRADTPVYAVDLRRPVVVAVGNEASGVSETVRRSGMGVVVPIIGRAESLNAAMALTAMMYEVARQRYE